ncbi:MAG: hypothetical protein U0V04_05495 [Spirosomataceae bacterium]|jgi:hypothetical protein
MRWLIFIISIQSFGQNVQIDTLFVKSQIDSAIVFLRNNQEKETVFAQKYRGEWPVYMDMTSPYFFMGNKQKARDSNGFTVASIHDFLSEIYLSDTSRKEILPILKSAFSEIQTYEENGLFYFWKNLPPNRKIKLFLEPSPQPLVRRPTTFRLKNRFINKLANVPADADDTSLGNLAKFYQNEIFGTKNKLTKIDVYENYLDKDRHNLNWFNFVYHQDKNSGAFMTWLHPEHEYGQWSVVKTAFNVLLIFVPGSSAGPKAYKPWVPFGANDIDVVVNANVLHYLKKSGQDIESLSAKDAINMIEKRLKISNWQNTSVYYSNAFHTHFAISRAFEDGIEGLRPVCKILEEDITKQQMADGSFVSRSYINHFDKIQSTANALYAMIVLRNKGFDIPKENIDRAMNFLLKNKKNKPEGIHWDGGVFFSGGSVIRNILFWESDAYTTAMIALIFQKYLNMK